MPETCGCHEHRLRLLKGLNAIDAILEKANVLPEWRRMIVVERRFGQEVYRAWKKHAKQATAAAARRITNSHGKVKEADLNAALKIIAREFSGLGHEMYGSTLETLREGYKLGMDAMNKKLKGKYKGTLRYDFVPVRKAPTIVDPGIGFGFASFDVADEEAVAALAEQHTFWIGKHYDRNLSEAVRRIAQRSIETSGGDPERAGRSLARVLAREFDYDPEEPFEGEFLRLPSGWSGSAEEYFEGVAAHAMTVGRVAGQLTSLSSVGATRYTVVNPMDERTCSECNYMAGHATSMPVDEAYGALTREIGGSPSAVRDMLHPFGKVADYRAVAGTAGKWSGAAAKRMIDGGYGFPPYHNGCRCAIDIADDSEFL